MPIPVSWWVSTRFWTIARPSLPTGERVHRHPDTVIIVTTNSDYAGCRDVNQSIISRMDLIYDIEAPDLATMVKRVMNVTGWHGRAGDHQDGHGRP